ncbi:hypothetical protein PAP_03005 [Palaeococcus pacificus DY20341]|uniref:LTD domain-containing protein n=1 Tax=Palaeococcus pacificus DY20341 TaxID=1343739 RepID=A0A075LSA6_9EURY|nr:lamin tail domain-containing protein [Palaeococcus pacificus]AIF69021.1 hypothetical protein PAP_03005 [Palaeococcus pacificus DY20341]
MKRGKSALEYLFLLAAGLILAGVAYNYLFGITTSYETIFQEISIQIDREFNQTNSTAPKIVISYVHYDAEGWDRLNLNDEYVIIANIGGSEADLGGWMLTDEVNHTYVFPSVMIKPGSLITVHTGKGTNTDKDLYWGRGSPVWNNNGDTAYLYASNGTLADSCSWTGKEGGGISCH